MQRIKPTIGVILALCASTAWAEPAAVRAGCDLAASHLAATPHSRLVRREARVANPRYPDRQHDACLVELKGDRREDHAPLRQTFIAKGWVDHPEYAADGADGSAYALFHRPDHTLCFVSENWHGHDDENPAYRPPTDFRIDVACTHDPTLAGYLTPLEEMERTPRVTRTGEPMPTGAPIRLPDGRVLVPAGNLPPPARP